MVFGGHSTEAGLGPTRDLQGRGAAVGVSPERAAAPEEAGSEN